LEKIGGREKKRDEVENRSQVKEEGGAKEFSISEN